MVCCGGVHERSIGSGGGGCAVWIETGWNGLILFVQMMRLVRRKEKVWNCGGIGYSYIAIKGNEPRSRKASVFFLFAENRQMAPGNHKVPWLTAAIRGRSNTENVPGGASG